MDQLLEQVSQLRTDNEQLKELLRNEQQKNEELIKEIHQLKSPNEKKVVEKEKPEVAEAKNPWDLDIDLPAPEI